MELVHLDLIYYRNVNETKVRSACNFKVTLQLKTTYTVGKVIGDYKANYLIHRLNFERLNFERSNFERPNFERLNFEVQSVNQLLTTYMVMLSSLRVTALCLYMYR